MKKKILLTMYVFLLSITGITFAQNAGNLYIENAVVASPNFSFEIHFEPTSWTPPPFNGLGDCSWYFNFNNAALNTPTLTYINPSLNTADYNNLIQLAGVGLDKIAVTTDYLGPGLGFALTAGTKYYLYKVNLIITNPTAESDLVWNLLDTGVFDILGTSTTETYVSNGDIPLPVELTAFTVEDGVDGVLLKWTTESEIENLGFILERRIAETEDWNLLVNYKTADALLGQGTVPHATDYEYIDKLVENGTEYEYRLGDVDYQGIVTYHATRLVTVNSIVLKVIPEKFELFAAYPNPFNPHATIRYNTPEAALVRITIYNYLGQKVRVLQNSIMQPGEHSVVWDSRDEFGQPVSAGVYLFNIEAGAFNKTHKMILLK